MANARFSLFLTILFSSTCVLFADNVPLFMWKNSENSNRLISYLDIFKSEDLKKSLIEQTTPHTTIIVFLADYLRTEDLSLRTDDGLTCYQEFSKIAGKSYIPAAESPFETMTEHFQAERNIEAYVTSEGELSEKFETKNVKGKQVVYVTLRSAEIGEETVSLMKSFDRVISKISKSYPKEDDVLFFFTGRHSAPHTRKARSASPAEDAKAVEEKQVANGPSTTDPTFFKHPNFLIYYTQLAQHVNKEESLIEITSIAVSDVTETSIHVDLKGKQTISLDLQRGSGYWGIVKGSLDGKSFGTQQTIAASIGFSYHCTPAVHFKLNGSEDFVTIRGLQIEPKFGSAENPLTKFSPPIDCVGFTSAGIWAGLFVTIMLLLILTIGISWILDIRTMDRFDDPKGKTITISVNE